MSGRLVLGLLVLDVLHELVEGVLYGAIESAGFMLEAETGGWRTALGVDFEWLVESGSMPNPVIGDPTSVSGLVDRAIAEAG